MKRHSGRAFAWAAARRKACAGIPLIAPQIGIVEQVRDDNQTFETASIISFFYSPSTPQGSNIDSKINCQYRATPEGSNINSRMIL